MENMDFTASNVYWMNTNTSIPNSGIGTNTLTKPAGVEVASIIPGRKHSVYIPSAATFTTSFNLDASGYTIIFYAKPEPGVVLSVDGNEVIFTGHSYTMVNAVGEPMEIPVRSNAARLIIFSYSDLEMSLFVDDRSGTIAANTTTQDGPLSVSLLESGGIIDSIIAGNGLLSTEDIAELALSYAIEHETPPSTTMMFDEYREYVVSREVIESLTLEPGQYEKVELRANEANSFKVEYEITGDVTVEINDVPWTSGLSLDEFPDAIHVYSETGGTVRNLVITEYYDNDLVAGSIAGFSTDRSSGTPAPTHRHDDAAANDGNTFVTLQETANTLAGWFRAGDGEPLPGVSMTSGVLTGTGLYVNGKPYTDQEIRDWYFLAKTGEATGSFTSTVPTHAIYASEETLTAAQIDDLYESFLGNATLTVDPELMVIADAPALLISTEWNIVASG